jgi:hypothetical protein
MHGALTFTDLIFTTLSASACLNRSYHKTRAQASLGRVFDNERCTASVEPAHAVPSQCLTDNREAY